MDDYHLWTMTFQCMSVVLCALGVFIDIRRLTIFRIFGVIWLAIVYLWILWAVDDFYTVGLAIFTLPYEYERIMFLTPLVVMMSWISFVCVRSTVEQQTRTRQKLL